MTEDAITELRELRREVSTILQALSPWISMDEMLQRYGVCYRTMRNMEIRKDVPPRRNGRWSRAEVIEWEGRPQNGPKL